MPEIRTVLCPIDFSPATERQIAVASELGRAFGARLVLHHNLSGATAAGVGWMWAREHPEVLSDTAAESRLHDLLGVLPEGVEAESRLTHGPAIQAVLTVGELVDADLVVLSTHGPTGEQHTSITERILEHSNRSLLVLHEAAADRTTPHFAAASGDAQAVLVPTDLSEGSRAALDCAFELAGRLPLHLHLLYVAEGGRSEAPGADPRVQLESAVPEALRRRVSVHVEEGDPGEAIPAAARRLGAACIMMGEHSHRSLWSWLRPDRSQQVLHRAPCPVWYVPCRAA